MLYAFTLLLKNCDIWCKCQNHCVVQRRSVDLQSNCINTMLNYYPENISVQFLKTFSRRTGTCTTNLKYYSSEMHVICSCLHVYVDQDGQVVSPVQCFTLVHMVCLWCEWTRPLEKRHARCGAVIKPYVFTWLHYMIAVNEMFHHTWSYVFKRASWTLYPCWANVVDVVPTWINSWDTIWYRLCFCVPF